MEKLRQAARQEAVKASEGRQHPTGSARGRKRQPQMRGGSKMVEKEGRQASCHPAAAENNIPRGKAQKAAPARRKGTFYLLLVAW